MIVLASQSPRRSELLRNAGIPFEVRAADVDESRFEGEDPGSYVRRLAARKAVSVARSGEVVLGADTCVLVDGQILGKPANAADARRMLALLSGRRHEVVTGICLKIAGELILDAEITIVQFSSMTEHDIESYVATGEPMDKAGAYAIQGLASRYVERIEGCYFNVVGLPVPRVFLHLKRHGLI